MGHAIVSGGARASVPLSGIKAVDLAVGSSVYLMENGVAVEYLVVNQGIPSGSSLYDASCDGTWLLRKDCYEKRAWNSSKVTDYENSTIHSYLNSDFFNLFGTIEKETIKQIKIPYRKGSTGKTISSGANGLSTKVFLLCGYEVGYTNASSYVLTDGARLSYFPQTTNASEVKVALFNGTSVQWFLRSPNKNDSNNTTLIGVSTLGSIFSGDVYPTSSYGIRPALILPSTAVFDKDTLILKGVA